MEILIQNEGTGYITYLQMVFWIQIQTKSTLSAIISFSKYLFMTPDFKISFYDSVSQKHLFMIMFR